MSIPKHLQVMLAVEAMAQLLEEGECPWREDTSQYREWYQRRKEAVAVYRRALS